MADSITHYIVANRYIKKHKEFSKEYIEGFLLGSQGPDVFYFGLSPESFAFGDKVHDVPPKALFEKDSDIIETLEDRYKGYYYGMLLHYFLDRIIHQYEGFKRRSSTEKYFHTILECSIDMIAYEREFGQYVQFFKFNEVYKYNKELTKTMLDFYGNRYKDSILTYKNVDKYYKSFLKNTRRFIRPSYPLIWLFCFLEKKQNDPWKYICHLKIQDNYRIELMNDYKEEWQGKYKTFNLSVGEMLDKALDDFEKELIIIKNGNYIFRHKEEFSCNK